MPRYEYRCTGDDCVQPLEGGLGVAPTVTTLDRPADQRDDPAECRSCSAPARRVFSSPSLPKMLSAGKPRRRRG